MTDTVNKAEELERIKRRLAPLGQEEDGLLAELYDDYSRTALAMSNRKELTPALSALARDAAVAAYHRRGDEGVTSSGLGGQSYSYEDIEEKLLKGILRQGLRVMA